MKRVVLTALFLSLSLLAVFQEAYGARPSSRKLPDFDLSNAPTQIGSLNPRGTALPSTSQDTGPIRVVTLATGLKGASDVAADSKYVYFTEVYGNAVKRVSVTGGQVQTLASVESPLHIAADSSYIYFNNASSIWRISKNGGSPQRLFSQAVIIAGLALDDQYVYYTISFCCGNGYLARIPKSGGTSEAVLSGLNSPWGIAVDDDYAYFIQTSGECSGIDSQITKGLWRVPKTGGGALRMTYSCTPWNVAIDSGFAYFTDSLRDGGSIIRVPKIVSTPGTGGLSGVHDTISTGNPSAQPIVADSYYVYYGESRWGGSVWRISKDGQEKTALAIDQNNVQGLALGEDSVYFAEFGKQAPCIASCQDFTELGAVKKVEQTRPDFSLSIEPKYSIIANGGTCRGLVSVSSINGYNSTVTLSTPNLSGTDLTVSFSPQSRVAPFQSIMTIAMAPNSGLGGLLPPYTVRASGAGLVHQNPIMIEGVSWPDYCIFANPFDHQTRGGQPLSVSAVEIYPLNGFAQSVGLTPAWLSESPPGVTVSTTPNPVSVPGTAQVTITSTSAPQAGPFSFKVRGPPAGAGIPTRYSQANQLFFLGVKNDPGSATTGEGFYPVGQIVRLSTPDSLAGSAFSQWIVDQTIAYTNTVTSIIMDGPHSATAYYQTYENVKAVADSLKDFLGSFSDSQTITNIVAEAVKGSKTYELDHVVTTENARLRGLKKPGDTINIMIDLTQLQKILASESSPNMTRIQEWFSKFENQVLVASAICALITIVGAVAGGVPGAIAGSVCELGVILGVFLIQTGLADYLLQKLGESFDWLRNNALAVANGIFSFGEWVSGSFLKIFGGSNVTMLLTDPAGKRLGATLEGGRVEVLKEVSGGFYSGSGSQPQAFVIPHAPPGVYTLQVTSQQSGDFHLESNLFSNWILTNSTKYAKTIQIGTYTYELTYGTVGKSCCLFIGEPTSQLWWWFWPLMVPVAGVASGLLVALVTRRNKAAHKTKSEVTDKSTI